MLVKGVRRKTRVLVEDARKPPQLHVLVDDQDHNGREVFVGCGRCGAPAAEDAAYCDHCGGRLSP